MNLKTTIPHNLNLPNLLDKFLPDIAKDIVSLLKVQGLNAFIVGGFVRDMILGYETSDFDFILLDCNVETVCAFLSERIPGNYFLLDKDTGTTRYVVKNDNSLLSFDFSPVSKINLLTDFSRRDFTINALAIDIHNPNMLIDNFGGLEDLINKKIKCIDFNNLIDDPLRFMRAFRFACELKADIDTNIIDFIKENLALFPGSKVSSERTACELWKILDNNNSFVYIQQLSSIGLLEKIFPELTAMKKIPPNDHHHLWLFDHSVYLVKTFEENFSKIPDWAKEELENSFGLLKSPTKAAVVKLGCILHDIGKPDTWEIKAVNGTEKHTFIGHDKLGAEITDRLSERLKFGNSITEALKNLVRYHLRPFQLSQNNEPITEKALYRFFRDVGDDTPLLLMLALSDHYATLGPKVTEQNLLNGEKLLLFLFDEYKKHKIKEEEKANKPKLLNGNEIMKLTGLSPSKKLGNLMKELEEAISLGEVKTKDEAKEWINIKTR